VAVIAMPLPNQCYKWKHRSHGKSICKYTPYLKCLRHDCLQISCRNIQRLLRKLKNWFKISETFSEIAVITMHRDISFKRPGEAAVIALPHDYYYYFFFVPIFFLQMHTNFRKNLQSDIKHRTVSSFFKFPPSPFWVMGGVIFNIFIFQGL